jgi:para-nitrobenzyl esterase
MTIRWGWIMSIRYLVGVIIGALFIGIASASPAPVATTKAGQVRGVQADGINIFKGVRYGATTEGRRFMAPLPPKPWTGVVDALDYGNQSPQAKAGNTSLFKSWANPRAASEDLLFLNVWTPGLRDGKKRPVMVWFHGGGHVTGSGSSNAYDGTRLAKKGDVVIVTVNHRLNTFGYLYLAQLSTDPALADSGNVGNLDMVLSLQWVRDNIAEFGGDPGNVLIFGESGGGAKVSTLMTMPSATGLFHRAVVQSGSSIHVRTPEAATASAKAFMKVLGLQPNQIDELRKLPMQKLVDALDSSAADASITFAPVLDGRSLARHPFDPDAPPASAKVPLMVGTIKDENTLLIGGRDPSKFALTWETLPAALKPFIGDLDVNALIAAMRKLYPTGTASDIFFTVSTVRNFRNGAIKQAELKSQQAKSLGSAPAFLYELVWQTPVEGGKWKAPHALDIGFVFDNVGKSESMSGIGPEQQKIADQMSDAWLKFARTGNPGWPAYDTTKRASMVFDVQSKVVNDFNRDERLLLSKLPGR